MQQRIYLDNAATSYPKAPAVAEVMASYLLNNGANLGRGSYESGYAVMEQVQGVRKQLADLFGASDARLVTFSLNVTHALNVFITGMLNPDDHVLISGMEHNAVVRTLVLHGISYSIIPCDEIGRVRTELLPTLVTSKTKALIITSASNVTGTIQPVTELGKLAHQYGLLVCIDTAQGSPTVECKLERECIDAIAFTGHKGLLGPTGTGGLVLSELVSERIRPMLGGGTGSFSDQLTMSPTFPDCLEAGTQNIVGILGLGKALEFDQGEQAKRMTDRLLHYLREEKRVRIIGSKHIEDRTATISIDVPNADNAHVAFALSQEWGIETRVGLHCAPLAHTSMHTLHTGTVRFSPGYATTEDEIDVTIGALQTVLSRT